MTRLEWGATGERVYEAGVDRGVLYVGDEGVVWNGLISVAEAPTGAEARAYYIDGYKYANRATGEEFQATIEAYTYPEAFEACEGIAALTDGLYVTQQRRQSFGLSYRSKIGNDVDGIDHGYKIHLIYNALVAPSQRTRSTISDSLEPFNFSWAITTRPDLLSGRKPTPHVIIDSRKVAGSILTLIENVLYGDADNAPRLPSIGELAYLMDATYASEYDDGYVDSPVYGLLDGGHISETETSTVDGGTLT